MAEAARELAGVGERAARRQRVAIVGAGFGGLFAAKALRRADLDLTVIDRTNHHLFAPLLYQMATGILAEGDIAPPIRDVLRRHRNTSVILGEVEAVDLESRHLTVNTLGLRREVPYDSLILATGADQSYFGHPEFARDAPGMKTIDHAFELRGRIFGAFEMAEGEPDPELRRSWLTFVVVGAGPTGVELAGQIAELARGALERNFPRDRTCGSSDPAARRGPDDPRFVPGVAAAPRGPPPGADRGRDSPRHDGHRGRRARHRDRRRGPASAADRRRHQGLVSGRRSLSARTYRGGGGGHRGRSGRRRPGLAGLHAARIPRGVRDRRPDEPRPPARVGPGRDQSGRHAAETIMRRQRGDMAPRSFGYRDRGTMATISRFQAIASIGPLRVSGFAGWLLWLVVHLFALTGFENRVAVLSNWAIAFLGRGRPQRAITTQQVFARQVSQAQAALTRSGLGAFDVRRRG